ncbi:MAG: hypothetical protein ACLTDR_10390 [Adlercreutzia equolifaciens]
MENDFENATISLYGYRARLHRGRPWPAPPVFVQGCSHGCLVATTPKANRPREAPETTLAALLARYSCQRASCTTSPLSGGEPFQTAEGLRSPGGRAEAQRLRSLELFRLPL